MAVCLTQCLWVPIYILHNYVFLSFCLNFFQLQSTYVFGIRVYAHSYICTLNSTGIDRYLMCFLCSVSREGHKSTGNLWLGTGSLDHWNWCQWAHPTLFQSITWWGTHRYLSARSKTRGKSAADMDITRAAATPAWTATTTLNQTGSNHNIEPGR